LRSGNVNGQGAVLPAACARVRRRPLAIGLRWSARDQLQGVQIAQQNQGSTQQDSQQQDQGSPSSGQQQNQEDRGNASQGGQQQRGNMGTQQERGQAGRAERGQEQMGLDDDEALE
jgi:hypothetical protein